MSQTLRQETIAEATVVVPRTQRRRRVLPAAVLIAVLLATAGYGYHWWTVGRWLQETDDAYVGGNVTAISPQVSGRILEILVRDNQAVKAGQLILRIDDAPFRAAADKAAAEVRRAEVNLATLTAQLAVQESTIGLDEADLDAKTAAAVFTRQDAQRYLRLATTSAGSQQNAQKAKSADDQAQAAVRAANAKLSAARQQLKVIKSQISEAEAAVASAKADLQVARLNLDYTEIRSPIDGYVGHRSAQVGAYVSSGAYLLTIVPSHGLWVDANFKEDQLADIKEGDPARLTVDAIPGKTFEGHVASFAPATGSTFSIIPAENATGNFTKIVQRVPLRVVIDDASASSLLRPGLSAVVTVNTRRN